MIGILGPVVAGGEPPLGKLAGSEQLENIPVFDVTRNDVARIGAHEGRIWIRLNPEASDRFAKFTEQNLHRMVATRADHVILLKAPVPVVVPSGELWSKPLDAAIRKRVLDMLTPK